MSNNTVRCRNMLGYLFLCGLLFGNASTQAEDWPTWRNTPDRTAVTTEELPSSFHLQWRRELGALKPAWPEDARLQFDAQYEPVIVDQTLYVSSSRNDSVSAIDLTNGQLKWRFHANGPVRFAPLVSGGQLYFGADDGYFYCLNAENGTLKWSFRAAPNDRKVLANGRLCSVWPVRGGPVLANESIYFTCGVWPFEGTFLYRFDVQNGQKASPPRPEVKTLDHLAPQGYLVHSGNRLLIPCGRSVAACLDMNTGRFISHSYGNRVTTVHVSSVGPYLFHGGSTFQMDTKKEYSLGALKPVLTDEAAYFGRAGSVVAYDLKHPETVQTKDRRGNPVSKSVLKQLWSLSDRQIHEVPEKNYQNWIKTHPVQIDLMAGHRLYGHQANTIFALDVAKGKSASVSWKQSIPGTPATMLAANGFLVVVTKEGDLLCFGQKQTEPRQYAEETSGLAGGPSLWSKKVQDCLQQSQAGAGYCLVLGAGSGQLVEELVKQSQLSLLVIEPDQKKVDRLRTRFDNLGLYGSRVVVHQGNPLSFGLPPYLAKLIVSEDLSAALGSSLTGADWQALFKILRPYGGTACLPLSNQDFAQLSQMVEQGELPQAALKRAGDLVQLSRRGALPGAANWTHEYGDASNSLMSQDELVKAPLGLLWYGGPAGHGDLFYNRHYWGPSMAVIEGRMFIQGPGKLTAVDVYTGRILWQIPVEESPENNLGRRGNDFEQKIAGHHFLAVEDGLYLVNSKKTCLRIDPATGKTLTVLKLPNPEDNWGRIRVHDDLLLASAFRVSPQIGEKYGPLPLSLVAMNRHTGEILWTHHADLSFPVVSLDRDRIYVFDGALENFYTDWKRRGKVPQALDDRFIKAIDVRTGKLLWKKRTDVVGTWLSYSNKKDVLLVTNRETISAFRGKDGSALWKKYATGQGFRGHPENLWDKIIIWNDQILDQRGPGRAYDLETGDPVLRTNPITGEAIPWEFTKSGHHCNYAIASPHLMTFRAASAGFCDIQSANTAHLEGFRSGCRNSLIPANGVLNSPNMAHGCSCGYSLFTSLALTHVPDAEVWSYNTLAIDLNKDQIKRLGINFGAPGDRQDDGGTLWIDHPSVGGASPAIPIKVTGKNLRFFRKHSAFVETGDLKWVAASGVEGASSVSITVATQQDRSRRYTIRLYFLEPDTSLPQPRIFDVYLNDELVLEGLNISKAAQGPLRTVVREFQGINIAQRLKIDLKARQGKTLLSGVELIAEE